MIYDFGICIIFCFQRMLLPFLLTVPVEKVVEGEEGCELSYSIEFMFGCRDVGWGYFKLRLPLTTFGFKIC